MRLLRYIATIVQVRPAFVIVKQERRCVKEHYSIDLGKMTLSKKPLKRRGKMRKQMIILCLMTALLVSPGILTEEAHADALLFPWIVKGDAVSTIISVVNKAGDFPGNYGNPLIPYRLHYSYWYKQTTSNETTEQCEVVSFKEVTSKNDVITFDASGIVNDGKPMYNDASPYTAGAMNLNVAAPRRAFLLVDNNTPGFVLEGENKDDTLYGEALVIDHITGMLWGYTAYNARLLGVTDTQNGPVYFFDQFDYQGEVIGPNEAGRTVLLPPDEYNTRFYITPIGTSYDAGGQRNGRNNTAVQLLVEYDGEFDGGMYDSDEEVYDFELRRDVVCTSAVMLEDLIAAGVYNVFQTSGEHGWAYIKTFNGTLDAIHTAQAAIGKLEWNTFTKTFKIDLSDSEECVSCKDDCIEDCNNKPGRRPSFMCEARCGKLCRKVCYIEKSLTTFPGNFQWIRSGDSLPLPEFN